MQNKNVLLKQIKHHINELSVNIGERPTGSAANHRAEDYIKQVFTRNKFKVTLQKFDCLDWEKNETTLNIGDTKADVEPSPYSLPCNVQAGIEVVNSIFQLEQADLSGKIAVLCGELTQEPLMPKNFRFYNSEHHQRIISLLEEKAPEAILTTSLNDKHLLPVFEDGDFDIPSVVFSKNDRDRIVNSNLPIHLRVNSKRKKTTGANVIARKGQAGQSKFVVTAHFDTKAGTPGALDNAVGVAVLLTLSEMLKETISEHVEVELVAFNGEDYFSTPGQIAYLDTYNSEFNQIKLAINCDGLGLKNNKTAISLMECSEKHAEQIESIYHSFKSIQEIPPWYQGDHMLFASAKVPTIAITSTGIFELIDTVIHTQLDTPSLIDPELILDVCLFLQEIINLEGKE
ncbi:Zn-dependent exopeptidase M28 [Leptolyngbyaceae cyanobacterium CCMR0082]|uniref:Zn-dependent exopeptidase M28 n=1 Tax=Adonisia turfae CCMR0082 TaxID=2304604 RepID=A0A6M0S2L1_9CYAN|nr:M28 family peptidase [Adonisia turfae]NEZ62162.1 Zn-dependent exopeptidase M28 [Adonisia turfae CCMR0082]